MKIVLKENPTREKLLGYGFKEIAPGHFLKFGEMEEGETFKPQISIFYGHQKNKVDEYIISATYINKNGKFKNLPYRRMKKIAPEAFKRKWFK